MKNKERKNKPQVVDSEDYDVNHPENLNTPEYNSSTGHRNPDKLPAIENLNNKNVTDNQLKEARINSTQTSTPINDEPLHGEESKTDLGNGQKDEKKKKAEKIIRT